MKFSRLVDKFEKYVNKKALGKRIKSEKLLKLQQLLIDKKSRYEAKLEATQDGRNRKKLETKLKVVDAHIAKSKKLSDDD